VSGGLRTDATTSNHAEFTPLVEEMIGNVNVTI